MFSHPTYHHFLGDGVFDSQLDVILYTSSPLSSESVTEIVCKLENPLVHSHHDLILSRFSLGTCRISPKEDQVVAPRVDNLRVKILWSEEEIAQYEELVGDNLSRLRETWCDPSNPASMSVLLQSTYSLLSSTAQVTNRFISLADPVKPKSRHHPHIVKLQKQLLAKYKSLVSLRSLPNPDTAAIFKLNDDYLKLKASYKHEIRQEQRQDSLNRDIQLHANLSSNPSAIFSAIKSMKTSSTTISTLNVGKSTYEGSSVPDGFYASLSSLKAPDLDTIQSSSHYQSTLTDYEHILKICRSGNSIPEISSRTSTEILISLKASVNDYYSITANHFINAGVAGFAHFHYLLSALIKNVNLASLEELNTIWACILYKGHGKDKESDRSYRTISTCPILAKALDTYIGQLFADDWSSVQAETQFQGSGSSHELAAIMLTEAVQFSLHVAKKPLFILLLDAKSAYDKVVKECAIKNAYLSGSSGHGLIYIDSRLGSRKTFIEWEKVLMGPIEDTLGVEQGGVNSDKIYKLCNNFQLSTAQMSSLGVDMVSSVVSSIGLADDTVLVSDSLSKLSGLLHLTVEYCKQYHVELVPEKTKLLAFTPPTQAMQVYLSKLVNPIRLDGHDLSFSPSAEHVGIIRSVEGNLPNILGRISARNRAAFALLPTGMARSHRGNPAAGLLLEKLYGNSVLLSGLGALVLDEKETGIIHHHHKVSLERIQRLLPSTPEVVVMFLAGSLPATGILHLRMLGLLGMIARLGPKHILNKHGRHVLLSATESSSIKSSWFLHVRVLSQKYGLPDPLTILQSAPSKGQWKSKCKSLITDFFEKKLRSEAGVLPSLEFFRPSFMSLSKPHPLWLNAGSPFEVSKAVIVARMLSGRYRTDMLSRHCVKDNPHGFCRLPGCSNQLGSLQHILLSCPALVECRAGMIKMWGDFMVSRPSLLAVVSQYTIIQVDLFMQFLLDPSCLPLVLTLNRTHPDTLKNCLFLSRTWCFSVHLARTKQLHQLQLR